MNQRSIQSLFFVALIFVAHLNCVVEHQLFARVDDSLAVAARLGDVENMASLPFSGERPDNECHEAGCLCKGATLADYFVIPESNFSQYFRFPLVLGPSFLQRDPDGHDSQAGPVFEISSGPLRALDRCAILQSFQI